MLTDWSGRPVLTKGKRPKCLSERLEQVKNSLPTKAKRAVELATEKGSSNWLTVIPLKKSDYNLNKKEFRDAIKLRYDWEITDTTMLSVYGVQFSVITQWCVSAAASLSSATMNCATLEAEMLRMVCNDVDVDPVLQEVTGEALKSWR